MHTLKIGTYTRRPHNRAAICAVRCDGVLPAATPEMVAKASRELPGRITADGKIVMSFHAFVLQNRAPHDPGRYDCCGANKPRPGREQFNQGKQDFLARLAGLGVKPEAVTHVMCTHLHWDHVGWNTRLVDGQWVPTFPNARYIMAKREYDYWDGVYAKEKGKATTCTRSGSRTACCRSCGPRRRDPGRRTISRAGQGHSRSRALPRPLAGARRHQRGVRAGEEGRVHRRRDPSPDPAAVPGPVDAGRSSIRTPRASPAAPSSTSMPTPATSSCRSISPRPSCRHDRPRRHRLPLRLVIRGQADCKGGDCASRRLSPGVTPARHGCHHASRPRATPTESILRSPSRCSPTTST